MKQTISLNDNYGNKIKDEVVHENVNNGLKGEVQIIVKNKKTGEIESQQRHNLIVYGGREWLLKKCFLTNTTTDNEDKKFLKNSELLWFGIGNGGGEPGNPLQCGCTYGSDKDLYNPIRLRYDFDTQGTSIDPYYASRIMPNGNVVSGYYKKLTYVGIKEDQANPYKKNGVINYPNLIAEVRLEVSSDDCCGQSWLNNDTEIEYADINEAALFIADNTLSDPGASAKLSYVTQDFMYYDPQHNRVYKEEDIEGLPEYTKSGNTYNWDSTKTFPDEAIQYFDLYNSDKTVKYNTVPILLGCWTDSKEASDKNKCIGNLKLVGNKLQYSFTNNRYGTLVKNEGEVTLPNTITNIDNIKFVSHGSICIDVKKTDRFDEEELESKTIECYCRYRNGYTTDFTQATPSQNLFNDGHETYKYIFPIGYVFNNSGELVEDINFNKLSIIRFIQSIDVYFDINVNKVVYDSASTEVKFYCDDEYIDKLNEGMNFYCTNLPSGCEAYPTEEDKSKIVEIFDGRLHRTGSETEVSIPSYFIIDRIGINESKEFNPPLQCKAFKDRKDSPYVMFNRCTFSTLRLSKSRELLLIWRIYF